MLSAWLSLSSLCRSQYVFYWCGGSDARYTVKSTLLSCSCTSPRTARGRSCTLALMGGERVPVAVCASVDVAPCHDTFSCGLGWQCNCRYSPRRDRPTHACRTASQVIIIKTRCSQLALVSRHAHSFEGQHQYTTSSDPQRWYTVLSLAFRKRFQDPIQHAVPRYEDPSF